MEEEYERQKEARVIGRRGRTSKGKHLPYTRVPAAVHRLAAAADVFSWTKKDRAEKGTPEAAGDRRTERTRIMNTYACAPRWDKFHGIRIEQIGPRRRTRHERYESDGALVPSRCFHCFEDHCPFFFRRFGSFSSSSSTDVLYQIWSYFRVACLRPALGYLFDA